MISALSQATLIPLWQDLLMRKQSQLPNWLQQWQASGREHFLAQGLPMMQQALWRDLNAAVLANIAFTTPSLTNQFTAELLASALAFDAYRLVFVNGVFRPYLSDVSTLPAEIKLTCWQDLMVPPALLAELATSQNQPFVALNQALLTDVLQIEVAAHSQLAKPIYFCFINELTAVPIMAQPRLVISVGQNAQATFIEHRLASREQPLWLNLVNDIFVAPKADVNYYTLFNTGFYDYHTAQLNVRQQAQSHFTGFNYSLGGSLIRHDLNIELLASQANTELTGLFFPCQEEFIDHHTAIYHRAPNTLSSEYFKGILADRARGVFNGRIYIARGAQQVKGYQRNANLLLNQGATVYSQPELEIYADDVQCSHGASTGRLDEQALFMLRSRGISLSEAQLILIKAFAETTLINCQIPEVTAQVIQQLTTKLAPQNLGQPTEKN